MINDNRIQWQKRECPIKLELVPYGSGWEDVTLEISGKRHWWSISGCLGDGFGALVESLYALYPHQTYDEREQNRLTQEEKYTADFVNGEYVNYRRLPDTATSYMMMPKTAEFYWDLEGCGVNWTLTKESGAERDFLLTVELLEGTDEKHETFRYEVKYSDMCYAVGKAMTEAVKKHGFAGFHTSVWESDVNMRHLCFLKACGMGRPDSMQPYESGEEGEGAVSSFDEELSLLLFDM